MGGNGDVVFATKNTALLDSACEKITGVRHCNGTDVWVIVHRWNSNAFYTYLVSASGVAAPVISNVGLVHKRGTVTTGGKPEAAGHLKSSPDGKKIAAAISWDINTVQIFDFDNSTGIISNPISIVYPPPTGFVNPAPIGVSFSPDNKKLYVSTLTNYIYQYDISSNVQATIVASQYLVATGGPWLFGALQAGPDGKIYVSDGPHPILSAINNPNTLGAGCNFADSVVILDTVSMSFAACTWGLPNFIDGNTSLPTPFITSNTPDPCLGGNVTLDAGSGFNSYFWSPGGASTRSIVASASGTYTVAVTTVCGTGYDTIIVNIGTGSALALSSSVTASSCGNNNGTATAITTAGSPPFTYLWNNLQTTQTATGLAVGNYTVTVTDATGCSKIQTAAVTQSVSVNLSTSFVAATCGVSDGTATVNATGGAMPYSYLWSNGQTSQTATGLAAGTYSVTVKEASTGSSSVFWNDDFTGGGTGWTLNQIGPGTNGSIANMWVINNVTDCNCGTGNYLHVTCSGSSGTGNFYCPGKNDCFYVWAPAGFGGSAATDKFVSSLVISTLGKANMTLKFKYVSVGDIGMDYGLVRLSNDGGVTWTDLAAHYENIFSCTLATVSIPALYENIANLKIAFRWINNADGNGSVPGFAIDDITLTAGAQSCSSTTTVTVGTSSGITASATGSGTTCANANGTATATPLGGSAPYTYLWNPSGATASTATGLAAGNYSVTIMDASGCSFITTASVSPSNAPTGTMTQTNVSCKGGNNGSADITPGSGTPPYTYLWDPGGETAATASGLSAGTYTVILSDGIGCSNTQTVTITEPAAPAIDAGADVSITAGANTVLNGSGGTNYSWSTGETTSSINVNPATTTTYTLWASDANGCSASDTVTVFVEEDCSTANNFFIPNAFSPNGDGDNDSLKLFFGNVNCIKEFHIVIYSRWGEHVFESTHAADAWDGVTGNKNGTAVYVYYIEATLTSGEQIQRKGNITLMR